MLAPGPSPLRGPEPWKVVSGVTFTTWDLWFLVVSMAGDEIGLCGVEQKLMEAALKPGGWGRSDAEAKLSHVSDLRARLAGLDMTPEDLVLAEVKDKKLVAKARTKVFEQSISAKAITSPMRDTPRATLTRRARDGYWPRFPVSPAKYATELLSVVERQDYYNESQGIRLAWRLDARREKFAQKMKERAAEILALDRAMLTACLEAQERADDSSGQIGMVFSAAIEKYANAPWEVAGIAAEVFIRDAVEFAIWEDFGQGESLAAIFTKLDRRHGDLAVRVFDETLAELESFRLFDYQVRSALAFKTELVARHRRFDEFVPLARKNGSAAWKPIVSMAKAAMKAKRADLAVAVFEAANQPGALSEYLAEQCVKITGKAISKAKPSLRRVK